MVVTIQRHIFDKSHLFSYKLTMQAMKIYNKTCNYKMIVVKGNVKKIMNKKKDIAALKKLTENLKYATVCPFKHAEIDRAFKNYTNNK